MSTQLADTVAKSFVEEVYIQPGIDGRSWTTFRNIQTILKAPQLKYVVCGGRSLAERARSFLETEGVSSADVVKIVSAEDREAC